MPSPTGDFPINVAIIGLSASAVTSWAADAHLPYLLSEEGRKLYRIVALCNSSVGAAQNAIKHYSLPEITKAYGDPQSLANDDEVKLVICTTRVDKHMETIMPSVKAGKDIFVEWPVASNTKDTQKLAQAAKEHNVQVVVGLQGRWSPPITKMKELLTTGKVGKVLSSEVHVFGGSAPGRDILSTGWEYFADKDVGGNHVTILFGHLIDQVQYLLAPLRKDSTRSHSQVQWPKIRVTDQDRNVVNTIETDVPDLFYLTGTFESSPTVVPSAALSASYHRAWPFPNEPTISWTITCEHADIRLRVYDYPSLQADAYGKPVLIDVRREGSESVETFEWEWPKETQHLPVRSRNTAYCLGAFAQGQNDGWASLESAMLISEQLENWLDKGTW